ncbi:shikimate O-hydroxycinnamoyltransferase [Selaginella moellendorffii]|uniref:shikimate O-hydroxycinnamoyltransferase n=1 Tax=Selaginella moellendorffii TaxID=88036 RepID=UPI000D1D0D92|nr:shikimate O-hydroxycinnamoyltransferase [Selaginella moellendorffii]|eukprot:XP_024524907.1 shikimate O-hydroxycinnamoyltransferase [Selaginella moellendorffii]
MVASISSVRSVSVSTVVPQIPTRQPCVLALSNFQSYFSFERYIKQVFYFSAPGSSALKQHDDQEEEEEDQEQKSPRIDNHDEEEFQRLVCSMRESLSRLLVPYYPLAGRMRRRERLTTIQELHCNDAGVMVVAAMANTALGDARQCPIEHELYPEPRVRDPANAPLLKIQVTKFQCGGIAVGVLTCENILDASSSFPFLRAWGEIHRGLALGVAPSFDSSVLKPRDPPQVNLPVRDYVVAPPPASTVEAMAKSSQDAIPDRQRLFHIAPDRVRELVAEVQRGRFFSSRDEPPPSSFEAISAMIWKCVADVKDLDDSESMTYIYALSTKGPKRWSPEIPSHYCGSSAHIPCLAAPVGEIRKNHISHAAKLLRDDIQSATQERIQSAIDWMELHLRAGIFVDDNFPLPRWSGRAINSNSLTAFPIYELDFGWGRPRHFSFVLDAEPGSGAAILLPTRDGGRDRHLAIRLPENQMKKLLEHQFFLKFATPV